MKCLAESAIFGGDGMTAHCQIVLRSHFKHGPSGEKQEEFVTHIHNLDDRGYHCGGYFWTLKDALEDFFKRCDRERVEVNRIIWRRKLT